MKSADLDAAVTTAVEGAFRNAGQKCTATSRIIVDQKIKPAFIEALVSRVKELKLGDAREADTFLGPVVDQKQYEKVRGYITRGLEEGGKLLCGGLDQVKRAGYFIAPTLFDHVTSDMTIAQQEIFGPVVVLLTISGLDEAITVANDTEYGLSASICTNDLAEAHAFCSRVASGVTSVNLPTAGVELHAPFGGAKASGFGIKEQGRPVLDFYTEWRTSYMKVG
jgi:aldehyde dehydrogenase (NAD+)